jgi:hypothetical protein
MAVNLKLLSQNSGLGKAPVNIVKEQEESHGKP